MSDWALLHALASVGIERGMTVPEMAAAYFGHEGADEHVTTPTPPGHLEVVRKIAEENGFPLSDWRPRT